MLRFLSFGKGLRTLLVATASMVVVSCASDPQSPPVDEALINVPVGFPQPAFPLDNVPDANRVALGKILFFSTELSRTRTVSCATCHDPAKAFTDGRQTSIGVDGRIGIRNAPSLANVGYGPYFLREGGVPTLEMQVLVPVQEHNEFDMNMLDVVERLSRDSSIAQMSRAAYGRSIDPYVVTRAIASFERTIISGSSRADLDQLNASERRGKDLFKSDATRCSTCHGGFAYTTHEFANNGVYASYTDNGRQRLTFKSTDSNVFKVPSLRNVGVTAPYMHNGRVAALSAVIESYDRGGYPHPNKDPRIRPLGLSSEQKLDLEAFLMSLTDDHFLTNTRYRP
ncbi:MAG: c-type cytochrome [Candidatus Kapabacteria bacterium]|nr:c-type cytochrome [Candidatus Kapabacteria bacterium]